ncbi:NMDA receptor-regulated protein 1 [Nannizzia gypsea CBS 118893]|uniref:NMDA receptor-regulated protein 1 n=1 Tax=Arthroderma gypseum (strain ATCC MYA-4604 / CBS 118893) TaxID=535722 RepID=E4V132_ARTGP|nr:NMDA receptor-regulated protein 1 [Nannizzia gypsea CBS 118893]EFR03747.1 NMDA receptor-regulated protein 1 [Nannizzia gypsea CBS 118893]
MPQPLSSKDSSLFRQVVRNCENKQYKKGLKAAEQILKKNPNHGDTQAMKGLMLSYQGQAEEAFALAKMALKNDMKSHICWHVYGLLYRAEKNYDEAIKAYRFALKLEPESQPIQRDLAYLQAQIRDFQGYIQSRATMLQQRPGVRQNWTALAIAYHLAGNLSEAQNVLTTFEETLKTPPPRTDMEHSEAILYKNMIIAESGDLEKALEHLEAVGKQCFDILAVMEMRADYLQRLGRTEEAATAYETLLERNPENSQYYDRLIEAKGIPKDDHKALKAVYDYWVEKNPRGDAPRRIPLEFLEGDDFKEAVDSYLQRMLRKGIPSTFANIKTLYTNPAKLAIVQELVEGYAAGNVNGQSNGSEANGDDSRFKESVLYFLAQHYNYHLSRDLEKAMSYVEKAIELSPKSVECWMTKARIWKHYGNLTKAAETMEAARLLDDKDRYINSKAVKYQLRHDENDKGLDNMSKFTRNETVGGALGDLHEMQCVWFLTEDGESYLRQRKLGLALKRFHAISNIFDLWQEDQFDFHNFSLRKGMIRAYIDMIRWENHLRDHPYYSRAAIGGIKSYLLLHDEPDLAHGPIPVNGTDGGPDSAERKKALKKAKKEQQRLKEAEAEKQRLKKASGTGAAGDSKKEDTDPLGLNLVHTSDPLKEAMKFLGPLLEACPDNIDAQTIGFEVYIRRKKYLLAIKCLMAAHAIDPSNPTLHVQLVKFRQQFDAGAAGELTPPDIVELINAEFDLLLPKSTDLTQWNEEFLSTHAKSAPHVQAALTVRQMLKPESKEQAEKDLISSIDLDNTSLEQALAGLSLLDEWGSTVETKASYSTSARRRWAEASVFPQ